VDQCHQSCVSKLPSLSTVQSQYTRGKVDSNLLTANLGSCFLTWSMELPSEAVVFLLAATDRGGMWHIVVNSLTNTTYPLLLLSRYTTVTILAISSQGLVDQVTVQLDLTSSHEDCTMGYAPKNGKSMKNIPKNVQNVEDIPRNNNTMEDVTKNGWTIVDIPTNDKTKEDISKNVEFRQGKLFSIGTLTLFMMSVILLLLLIVLILILQILCKKQSNRLPQPETHVLQDFSIAGVTQSQEDMISLTPLVPSLVSLDDVSHKNMGMTEKSLFLVNPEMMETSNYEEVDSYTTAPSAWYDLEWDESPYGS